MSKARDIADLDFNSPDIDGGNIDGAVIGATTAAVGSFTGVNISGGSQLGQDFAYFKSASTTTASLTLRKDSTGADAIDFLQLRNDGNSLIGKIEGDGDISFKDGNFTGTVTADYDVRVKNALRIQEGSSMAGGIFKEHDLTGSGNSLDISIFAESITNGGAIHFMTGGSATKRLTINSLGSVGIGAVDGDVTSDGNSARTYVGIIGTGNRGRLNLGSTASNGADAGTLAFTNGANVLADISVDTTSGVQNTGTMYVNGTRSIKIQAASGDEVVFNEGSNNTDFRVESNSRSHALFVDASADGVGIGNDVVEYMLDVGSDGGAYAGGRAMRVNSSGDTIFSLSRAGTSLFSMRNNNVHYTALSSNNGAELMLGYGSGDAGAINDHLLFTSTETVVNEGGADRDFRVEGANNADMFVVDAGNDRVSIGSSGYTSTTDLNLLGDGLSIKNDKNGSSNNWSLIQNTAGGSQSNLVFIAGAGTALTLNHDRSANFPTGITVGASGVSTPDHRIPAGTGYITYSPGNVSTDTLIVRKYGTTQQKFDQNGVTFPLGIKFGTDTAAANTLDDYEEGTWTPQLTDASANDCSYTGRTGHYTKIGNLVYVIFAIQLSSRTGVGNGLQIRNLPFSIENVSHGGGEPSGGAITYANNLVSTDLGGGIILRANNATNYIEMKYTPGGAQTAIGGANWNANAIGSNTYLTGYCLYRT